MYCECHNNVHASSSFNYFIRKSFKRLPTKLELTRFRKYARRMREVGHNRLLDNHLSSEVFLVLHRFAFGEPLLPNLKTLQLSSVTAEFVPFILLLVSPGTTTIDIGFGGRDLPKALVASTIAIFPTSCPNLQQIRLHSLPRDPMIIAAVSELLLTTDRGALRSFRVDSPLTEEAREVICKLPGLCTLGMVIERDMTLPSLVLPNLRKLIVKYNHGDDCLQIFHGATLGKLETVNFIPQFEQTGDFLGAFERVALAASIQNTLSELRLYTSCPWNPTYSSLLPFTQLTCLNIVFSCGIDCSSSVDDDIITNLARAMPKLEHLKLGATPCRLIPTGVTAKGLMVLARHCPNLLHLRTHFQVASLSVPPATIGMTSNTVSIAMRRGCALTKLDVGEIPVLEESVLVVALTLVRIFPHLETINYTDESWEKVTDAISLSRRIVDCLGKDRYLERPRRDLSDASTGATLESGS